MRFLFLLLMLQSSLVYAQTLPLGAPETLSDTVPEPIRPKKNTATAKNKSLAPGRNALLFGILPGGGQIYNQSFWKLPIVYGGMAGIGYFMADSGIKFQSYRRAYREAVDEDPTTNYRSPFDTDSLNTAGLKIQRDKFQSQFEYATLGFMAFYGLVLVDAFVDAHLKDFDVSDDLSMGIRPRLQYDAMSGNVMPSIRLTVRPRS